ncbi:MAG: hypothetical protein ACKVPJ_00560 [Chitinophagales bacterium]
MYQFITGIVFELTIIVIFTVGFLLMNGNIKMFLGGEEFEDWRLKNGRIVKYICLFTLVMLLASIGMKYILFTSTAPDMLPTD